MDGGPGGKGNWVRKMNRHVDAKGEGPSEWREGSEWPMCIRGVAQGVSGVLGQKLGMKRGKARFLKDVGPVERFGYYTGAGKSLLCLRGRTGWSLGFMAEPHWC